MKRQEIIESIKKMLSNLTDLDLKTVYEFVLTISG